MHVFTGLPFHGLQHDGPITLEAVSDMDGRPS